VFTAGEQLFFHDKQFKNDPKHCKQCKAKRVRGGSRVRPETRTVCSQCGNNGAVQAHPRQAGTLPLLFSAAEVPAGGSPRGGVTPRAESAAAVRSRNLGL
jgi:hypothetical protein